MPCKTSACVLLNPANKVRVVSHVDDFLCSGPKECLIELRRLLKEKYEVDGGVLGPNVGETHEGKFLGRLIRYTARGIEWESDPKLVDSLIAKFGLESGKGVDTPGIKSEWRRA